MRLSLSTEIPLAGPTIQLFGNGFGQLGSTLKCGGLSCALAAGQTPIANRQIAIEAAAERIPLLRLAKAFLSDRLRCRTRNRSPVIEFPAQVLVLLLIEVALVCSVARARYF